MLLKINYPQRKSPRLLEYDYSTEGAYFITICVKDRHEVLGKILDNSIQDCEVQLSEYGAVVEKYIDQIQGMDKYVIMPNHLHMIIFINEAKETSISQRIKTFKTLVTKELGFSIFQRSFHDHIIRNEKEYLQIWEYIENNPVNWATDCFYKSV